VYDINKPENKWEMRTRVAEARPETPSPMRKSQIKLIGVS